MQRSNKGRRTISSSMQTLTELGSQPDGLRGNLRARGPRRPAELPARSRSMTMTRWSNGAEGRRRGDDSLWTLRSDGTGKKARTAARGSLLVDGSHAGQRQQNRCANSFLRPDLKAGSRTTRAIIPRAMNRVLPWSQCAYDAGARVKPNKDHGCRPRRTCFPWDPSF